MIGRFLFILDGTGFPPAQFEREMTPDGVASVGADGATGLAGVVGSGAGDHQGSGSCDTDLRQMQSVEMVLKCMESQQFDTTTLLEIIAAALVRDTDRRYEILAESSVTTRADIIRDELLRLEHLLLLAGRQRREGGDYNVSVN